MRGKFELAAILGGPWMFVVVDTEEEFDWKGPFNRENKATASIRYQERAQRIYQKFGVSPTYVVDYCVAVDAEASAFMREMKNNNACEIGAHLHTWVTPPYVEELNIRNSFQGNLPYHIERAKIRTLTRAIEEKLGFTPRIFKAGRYGIGPNTFRILREENYLIDCSYVPYTSFASVGGPSFLGTPSDPFWIDRKQTILEIPLTKGFIGPLSFLGPLLQPIFDHPVARRLCIPGVLSRLGVSRTVLSPEGVPTSELIRFLRTMYARGKKVFVLTYHSPSLVPGNTPYVRTNAELNEFFVKIRVVLEYFKDEVKGSFPTFRELYTRLTN